MTPQDFVYSAAFKQFMALGFSDRDAGYVGADAVRRWRKQGGGSKAIKDAVSHGKKLYKPSRKSGAR